MRVCLRNSDNRIIEAQSGGAYVSDLAILVNNAVEAGYQPDDVRVVEMDDAEFSQRLANQSAADRAMLVPDTISGRQFFQQLAVMGAITPAEALAAVKT